MDGKIKNIILRKLPEKPLVSIIVPSYNQGDYIKKTIDSVLGQSYRPIELIVVDGGSTDRTLEELRGYDGCAELKWISERDDGVADAVNKGFSMARGDILAVQSSDDHYMPDVFGKIVEEFVQDSELGLLYGDIIQVNGDDDVLYKQRIEPFSMRSFLSHQTWIPQPAAFFRQELAEQLSGWDGSYYNCDTEFWFRAVFRTKVKKIDEYISKRLRHKGQRDENYAEICESYWKIIDNSEYIKRSGIVEKRAAACGKFMHAIRYNPTKSDWMATYYFWRAILLYPPMLAKTSCPKSTLIPGYIPLLKRLSWIKQKVFRIPGRRM